MIELNRTPSTQPQTENRRSEPKRVADDQASGTRAKERLFATFRLPRDIGIEDKTRMFFLMRAYYADMTERDFIQDLAEKDMVIVLRDRHGMIQGFSTLLNVKFKASRRTVVGSFSGDTVIERAFWGRKELGVAFLKYLFMQKLKNPFRSYYWFLISKGYKTYLLMANNFVTHYPRYEKRTPRDIKEVMDTFYSGRFPALYDKEHGLIKAKTGPACRLREGVAAVTGDLCRDNPRVDFFAYRNPDWQKGVELACLAEMKLTMPLSYMIKKTWVRFFNKKGK